jgi:hypothetical protein
MTTKKLKNFEYAGYAVGELSETGQFLHEAFDTPNGFVFVVAGSGFVPDIKVQPAAIIAERLQYYLENEVAEDPKEAVHNALVYVNGFLYAASRKEGFSLVACSCLCVLVRDQKVYYAWLGEAFLHFFTGRKLIELSHELTHTPQGSVEKEKVFLGTHQFVTPGLCEEALVPVDGDQLLLGCAVPGLGIQAKSVKRVLSDNMPTHTKALRLIKGTDASADGLSLQLLLFYNLQHDIRSFALPEQEVSAQSNNEIIGRGLMSRPWWQMALALLAITLLAYMTYDLFLYNPRPGQRLPSITEQIEPDEPADTLSEQDGSGDEGVAVPADITYTVRSGDTWGRIYGEFEVCSWFIRNHEPNRGKFDRSGNPVAGSRLLIPVVYSARRSLNPAFYEEFSLDKVGSSCENAGQEFLNQFEKERLGKD